MRTHPRRPCTPTLSAIAALALVAAVAGGCGKSDENGKQAAAPTPSSTQSHAAPTQNPLTSGTTSPAPTPTPTPPAATQAIAGGTRIDADGVSFIVPEEWEREAVSSSMRAAQYKVPATEGEGEEGTFVVFRGIGGSPEDNIQRWIGQITDKPSPPERATFNANGLTIYTVSMTGTYSVGPMMGGTGNPEPDTMFLGAVITGGPAPTPIFFRLTGPRSTIEHHAEEWNALIASAQPMTTMPAQ